MALLAERHVTATPGRRVLEHAHVGRPAVGHHDRGHTGDGVEAILEQETTGPEFMLALAVADRTGNEDDLFRFCGGGSKAARKAERSQQEEWG